MNQHVDIIKHILFQAGKIVLDGFKTSPQTHLKENQSNIVTAIDFASEKYIVEKIEKNFPNDTIIGEETGFFQKTSDDVWIIDPLDGTSNFAAGIPWFGVMITYMYKWVPEASGIYLPFQNLLYMAQYGKGAYCNGNKINVTDFKDPKQQLFAYQVDYTSDSQKLHKEMEYIQLFVEQSRNLRSTNCCLDLCFVADGKFGACMSQSVKIWDIAPSSLLISEAGGKVTDINGNLLKFLSTKENFQREFNFLAANPHIHSSLLSIIKPNI